MPPSDLIPSVWVDTQVMAEVFSQGDVYADEHRGPAHVERRRLMLQESLHLAMALDERATITGTFGHEFYPTINRLAPAGEDVHMWTRAAFQIARPYVYPQWVMLFTRRGADLPTGRDGNNDRDALMVQICNESGLHLVTRDVRGKHGEPGATKRARDAGVRVSTPTEYAESVLPFATARDRFMERLRVGAVAFAAAAPVELRADREAAMEQLVETHEAIWEPPWPEDPPRSTATPRSAPKGVATGRRRSYPGR